MIRLENLTVMFGEQVPVVDRMSMDIEKGKRTVIVGESGSGKSVTILAVLGLLPQEANITGSIKLNGRELLTLSDDEMNSLRGKELGYVPQGGGGSMNPLMSVGAQIAEPIIIHQKAEKGEAHKQAVSWMDRLGLKPAEKIAASYPHTLSGGMRQRALTAMGAAGGADVLLTDEPTKGLDDKRIKQVEELFESMEGKTILCVTHDLRFAKKIAHNICVMYGGKIVEFADSESFFSSPKHPYSQMLLAALPENGMDCPEGFTPPFEKRTGCPFYNRCPKQDEACLEDTDMFILKNHEVRCRLYAASD